LPGIFFGRLFDNDQAAAKHGAIQEIDRFSGFIGSQHPDVSAPPEVTRYGISYQVNRGNGACNGKQFPHFILRDSSGDMSNINFYTHVIRSFISIW
jgi:hypothetical protein